MAVQLSANANVQTSFSEVVQWNHTCGASDTLLIVFAINADYTGGLPTQDVSYGTTDFFANQFINYGANTANCPQIAMTAYYLLNPTPGTEQITLTFPEYNALQYGFSLSFTGTVTSGNPIANLVQANCGSNLFANLTTTSATGDLAIGWCGMVTGSLTSGASQNTQDYFEYGGDVGWIVDALPGSANPNFTWTGSSSGFGVQAWNAVAFDILAAGGSYVSPQQFKVYSNGAFQANAFVTGGLPAGIGMRMYSNNVCQVGSIHITGVAGAGPRLFSNGQLQVASTIIA